MLRPVLFLHRWLGVVVGLIMTLWCLSGFVMMYADYPRLLPAEQLRGLAPLRLPAAVALPEDAPVAGARIEMLAGRAVLRAGPQVFDLASGRAFTSVSAADVRAAVESFAARSGIAGPPVSFAPTGVDQWTVQNFARTAPLYRADFAAGEYVYISGKTGEIVQSATRSERFWAWLGAVPHWLYIVPLREDGEVWSQVVIWTSLLGCFLTITGIWTGIARLRRKRNGGIGSPFRGIWWWHHIFGLCFGLLTLTWVTSGLVSMNPWGFLGSMAGLAERERLAGTVRWRDIAAAMAAAKDLPASTVRLEAAPLDGQVYLVAVEAGGKSTRLAADGKPSLLTDGELRLALNNGPPLASLTLLREEDSYYYAHKFSAPLPVWRAILADAERTRLYIDPVSGRLIRAFDGNGRSFRWLQNGLHSLDLPLLRKRPVWDIVVLPLLAMVTLVCATGTWMGVGRIRRDLRRWRRRRSRRV